MKQGSDLFVLGALVVLAAALVLALAPGAAAQEENRVAFEKAMVGCMNNVRNLAALLEIVGRDYPKYAGANLVLYLVKKGEIRGKHLPLLFCPGDQKESLKKAGGADAYKKIDLDKQEHGKLTSYAGRDQKDRNCAAKRGDANTKVLVCDDSEDHHGGKGMVVGLTGGAAKWRDKKKHYKLKPEQAITVGKKSLVKELQCLRAD